MKKPLAFEKISAWFLLAFATTAVFSIVWQHLIWVSVLFWLMAWAKGRAKPDWPQGLLATATLLFLSTFFIGALSGVNPANSFGTLHRDLTFFVFFLVGAMRIDFPRAQKLLLFFTRGAAFCGVWGIFKHFFLGEGRITSISGDIMIFGGFLMTALVIQAFFVLRDPKNIPHWGVFSILSFALLLNQTRGAWIGLVVGLLPLFWFFKRKWLLPAAGLLVVAFFLLPETYHTRIKSIWDQKIFYDNAERVMMWKSGWAISKDYPLFGIGQGNLMAVYPEYKNRKAQEPEIPHLHNNFVQILVQNGWAGFLAYLFWIGSYFFESLRKRKWQKEIRDWNLALTCVFLAGLIWGLTEYTFTHRFMNVQFFMLGLQANLWRLSRA